MSSSTKTEETANRHHLPHRSISVFVNTDAYLAGDQFPDSGYPLVTVSRTGVKISIPFNFQYHDTYTD